MTTDNPVYTKNIAELITIANDFCLFAENLEETTLENILTYLSATIPLLYIKGSLLEDVEVSDELANERYVTEQTWQSIYMDFGEKFGDKDEYYTLSAPDQSMEEGIKASLADNLADIYQDMKDFLLLFNKNQLSSRENAVSEIKRLFETHWGPISIRALQAVHYIIHKEQLNAPSEEWY